MAQGRQGGSKRKLTLSAHRKSRSRFLKKYWAAKRLAADQAVSTGHVPREPASNRLGESSQHGAAASGGIEFVNVTQLKTEVDDEQPPSAEDPVLLDTAPGSADLLAAADHTPESHGQPEESQKTSSKPQTQTAKAVSDAQTKPDPDFGDYVTSVLLKIGSASMKAYAKSQIGQILRDAQLEDVPLL